MDISQKLLQKVRKMKWIFALTPHVREVFVVNSVAQGHAHAESDIDLLVVTDSKKVLEARCVLTFLTHMLGVRVHGKKRAGRLCLSFFVDVDNAHLHLLAYPNSTFYNSFLQRAERIYTAHPHAIRTLLGAMLPQWLVSWHTKRALHRAGALQFTNPSIVITPSIFKFHENDGRRRT